MDCHFRVSVGITANELFNGCKPLDGEPLRILNETFKKHISKSPTSLLMNNTHQPKQILVRVETKDGLPKEKGLYIIGSGTKIKTDYFNGKKFSYDFHNETTYWYEPATAIVLSVEEYEEMGRELFMLKNGLGNSDMINDNKPTDI